MSIETDADDKLEAKYGPVISINRFKEPDEVIGEIYKSSYTSFYSSLGFIGTSASPFLSYYSISMQTKHQIYEYLI